MNPPRLAGQRSEELELRCEKLRVEQEERDYRRMTNNVRRDNEKVARWREWVLLAGIEVFLVEFDVSVGSIGDFCW